MRIEVKWEKWGELVATRATMFCAFCLQWIEYLERSLKRILQKSKREWIKALAIVIAAILDIKTTNATGITELKKMI